MTSFAQAREIVHQLSGQYTGAMWGGEACTLYTAENLNNSGFIGSNTVVVITSLDSINHQAPACVAAPIVNMVAKNKINFGTKKESSSSIPVRLYSPIQLSITTKHLSIDDFTLVVEPNHAILSCKKLSLYKKPNEEDPSYFEVVKSWAINDEMEVEIV